jgi:hypothetical protein
MRIHFGIKHGNSIKWPERCLWCSAKPTKWQKYRKKSVYGLKYGLKYYVFCIITILSRIQTIYYPVCAKHNLIAHLLRPSRLLWCAILIFIIFYIVEIKSLWLLVYMFLVAGYLYYRKHGLIIHKVGENYLELSMPDGKYAEEFGILNNCNNIKGHLLIQD